MMEKTNSLRKVAAWLDDRRVDDDAAPVVGKHEPRPVLEPARHVEHARAVTHGRWRWVVVPAGREYRGEEHRQGGLLSWFPGGRISSFSRNSIWCLATLIVLSTACAANQPGQGVSRNFAYAWGCNPAVVEYRADELSDRLPPNHSYIPEVGWDACTLMAHVGAPRDVDRQQYGGTREARWWYPKGEYGTRLVSLRLEDGDWIVRYVDW